MTRRKRWTPTSTREALLKILTDSCSLALKLTKGGEKMTKGRDSRSIKLFLRNKKETVLKVPIGF